MSDYTLEREDMVEPIERMFSREFEGELGMFQVVEGDVEAGEDFDIVYVHGDSENLHVIRLEEDYDSAVLDFDSGIHTVRDADANNVWVALPLYEFREGEDRWNDRMKSECDKRGIGIISAQKKGRGVSAKILQRPDKREGNFLQSYDELKEQWDKRASEEEAPEGFRIVNYYEN